MVNMMPYLTSRIRKSSIEVGPFLHQPFFLAEAVTACSMIGEKACIHRRNFFLSWKIRYLGGVTLLSEDQCSLGKPNETIEGRYESWPDRSNGLQFIQFQCCIDFTFDDFRSLLVP